MASYTIITYDPGTELWGWVGTQNELDDPDEYFESNSIVRWRDEIITLPKHFLQGARVHVKRMVIKGGGPKWYWIENSLACRADLGER